MEAQPNAITRPWMIANQGAAHKLNLRSKPGASQILLPPIRPIVTITSRQIIQRSAGTAPTYEQKFLALQSLGVKNWVELATNWDLAVKGSFQKGYEYQIDKTLELARSGVNGGVAAVEVTYNNGKNRADIEFNDKSFGEIKRTSDWGKAWPQLYKELAAYAESGRNLHLYIDPLPDDATTGIVSAIIGFRSASAASQWTLNGVKVENWTTLAPDPNKFANPLDYRRALDGMRESMLETKV